MFQTNILVDKEGTPQIAGLGSASTLSHSSGWTTGDRASSDRLSRNRAPEMIQPGVAQSTHPTKSSDMYAFGIMAWEVRSNSFVRYPIRSPDAGSHWAAGIL